MRTTRPLRLLVVALLALLLALAVPAAAAADGWPHHSAPVGQR